MHWIQKYILRQLATSEICRYSQLKPDGVEGNLFMYHLRVVTREGYVQKVADGYQLTASGKQFVDRISMEKFQPRIQPKIVTLLIVKNPQGQLLLWRRNKQPFIHKVGFITGKIHLGESINEAANRELYEKAGLTAKLRHAGDGYLTVYEEQELISQVMFHCFSGKIASSEIPLEFRKEVFWGEITEQSSDLTPGAQEIYELAKNSKNGERFFAEITK